jgi:ABC-type branched-subunit amino acid transport system permease subunit
MRCLHIWAEMSDYRLITLKLTLIAVLFTLSLNIINGYMGEFSCSHPGFMAIGAYMSSFYRGAVYQRQGAGRCGVHFFRGLPELSPGLIFGV